MRQPAPARFVSFACLAVALIAEGCGMGAKTVTVTGRALQNGKPIKLLPAEEIRVGVSTEASEGEPVIAAWATARPEDGAFTLSGPDGKGIPPGKYRVVVSSQIYQQSKDRFEAVFDENRPPLIVDVTAESGQYFVIDVGTRTVTKR